MSVAVLYLVAVYPQLVTGREICWVVRGNLNRWTLWANLFGNAFGYSLFALSTRFIDPGIGAVIIETWPLMAMFLIVGLMRGHAPRRL